MNYQVFWNVIGFLGMDRLVRMWNPYVVAKPIGMLRGHTAPIVYLAIAEEDFRIFSISTDKCIRVCLVFTCNYILIKKVVM